MTTLDTGLYVNLRTPTWIELQAVNEALGFRSKGEVIRQIMDGRLPPLQEIPTKFDIKQAQIYHTTRGRYV